MARLIRDYKAGIADPAEILGSILEAGSIPQTQSELGLHGNEQWKKSGRKRPPGSVVSSEKLDFAHASANVGLGAGHEG